MAESRVEKLKRWAGRLLRIVLGLALIALVLWAFPLEVMEVRSVSGVINAPLTQVRAPVSGHVLTVNAAGGQRVIKDTALFTIANDRVNESLIEQLNERLAVLQAQAEAGRSQVKALRAFQSALAQRTQTHVKDMTSYLEHRVKEAEAELAGEKAKRELRDIQAKWTKQMYDRGAGNQDQMAEANALKKEAEARAALAERAVGRLNAELEAAKRGVFLRSGYNDVPYSRQRLDELEMRVIEAESQVTRITDEVSAVKKRIVAETEQLNRNRHATVGAPTGGLIWQTLVMSGQFVEKGEPLVKMIDPSKLYVVAVFHGRNYDGAGLGDKVMVRVDGSHEQYQGQIRAKFGGLAQQETDVLVAKIPDHTPRQFLAIIELDKGVLPGTPENLFNIGRAVEVELPKKDFSIWRTAGSLFDRVFGS